MKIPLSDITFVGNESTFCQEALSAKWISGSGPYLTQFENLLAKKTGRRFAICVANGTMALELALRAMNIGPGDEVIVPALTFAAPAASVMAIGATPVFADIDEATWTVDIDQVRKVITSKTRAIIAVDVFGHPCNYSRLEDLGIPILEDAAEAHGALYNERPVGSFGVASVFSFHANKTITTGEGGCVTTDDEALYKTMRLIANHGMSPDNPYWHTTLGRNFRMTNLAAAIGCGQAEKWDELVSARNNVARSYDRLIKHPFIYRRPVAGWAREACWLYTLSSPYRNEILKMLRQNGIDARAIWHALPANPVFQSACTQEYPVAFKVSAEAFWLPTWAFMPQEKIEYTARMLMEALQVAAKTTVNERG